MKVGDVILQVNGKKVDDSNDLRSLIGERRPGESVNLKVWRKKSTLDIKATLMAAPGTTASAKGSDKGSASIDKVGLKLRPLQSAEARKLDADGGLLIEAASGPAARASLRTGDVILMANNQPVSSVEELQDIIKDSGERLLLLVQRGEGRAFVALPLK
ncbi:MAG: PDZ domain-containing protein [Rhodocyclaceae bacterium]